MKKFILSESEKARILGMHYDAMGKTLVNEDAGGPGTIQASPRSQDLVDKGMNYVGFTYIDKDNVRTEYFYNCTPYVYAKSSDVNLPGQRAGDIVDSNVKYVSPDKLGLKGDYKANFKSACQNIYTYFNNYKKTFCADPKNKTKDSYKWLCPQEVPQAQVAGATTPASATAPNPVSNAEVDATQKRQADAKAKRDKANVDLKTLMSSPSGFLKYMDSNAELITDKTTLDAQAKELSRVLNDGAVPEDRIDKQELIRSMRNLVRNFPEYGESPYFFNNYITQLIG